MNAFWNNERNLNHVKKTHSCGCTQRRSLEGAAFLAITRKERNDNMNKTRHFIEKEIDQKLKDGYIVIPDYEKTLSTNDARCLGAIYCLEPKSIFFGKMFLYLEYGKDIYRLWWVIRTKGNQDPTLSNRPQDINKALPKTEYGIDYITWDETTDGGEAFMQFTPLKYLDGFDKDLRLVMQKTRHYVAENKLCRKIRMLEK